AGAAVEGIERAVSKSQHVESLVLSQAIRKGEGLLGEVADLGTSILIEHPERDPRVPKYEMDFLQIRSIVMVPMRFRQGVLGVLAVVNRVDGQAFTEADTSMLQALADQASVSVYYAGMRETLLEKQRMDGDLSFARQIQSSLLPREIPQVEGVELAAFNVPAQEVGGDYYDFVKVDDSHIGMMIADVSGKGIAGAIVMSMCRSALRAQAPGCLSPSEVLRAMNRALAADLSEDMFVSALYMVLNVETREIVISRAGHERPILISGQGDGFSIIDSAGIAIGIADIETFEALIVDIEVALREGDLVVAYTDGITEAMNERREEWGVDNFLDALRISAAEGAQSVLNNVQERALRFVGNMPQYDDMTLLALRVLG
ncbi:MAG: SpoIIE family protein phosphatase, partial [Verrucomicrobia bacterium]|nr:SpoIIE family protein phosphatase [Verrucomicrobiota bacterium]